MGIPAPENPPHPLTAREDLFDYLNGLPHKPVSIPHDLLAPIEAQEVWAAGVTYHRSRSARMVEAQGAGGGDFYGRVYKAKRPELFMKSTAHRVVARNPRSAFAAIRNGTCPNPS
jgi:2-dehydro-3-deoxy-D-arabinonate dehydratase